MGTHEMPPYFDLMAPNMDSEFGERRSRNRRPISPALSSMQVPALSRCVSTASTVSTRSSSAGGHYATFQDRHATGAFGPKRAMVSFGELPLDDPNFKKSNTENAQTNRRGYVRPQGTHFARSAQHRDSVMSLGSIAHLQYYFARTGLLDGKGGRLARKKSPLGELDVAQSTNSRFYPSPPETQTASHGMGFKDYGRPHLSDSPIQEEGDEIIVHVDDSYDDEDFEYLSDEEHPEMLHPHVSTYNPRQKPLLPPPSLIELKTDLQSALEDAAKALAAAKQQEEIPQPDSSHLSPTKAVPEGPISPSRPNRRRSDSALSVPESPSFMNRGWYELQGMHILDVVTLAIRAAKLYYTAHENPERLASIRSEKRIRSDLLAVMEILKKMATRSFAGGMKTEERETIDTWVKSVRDMLKKEAQLEEEETERQRSWEWLDNSKWPQSETHEVNINRELAFLTSMDPTFLDFPAYERSDFACDPPMPSEFLCSLQDGIKLIELHNAIVKKSKRSFGSIPKWHSDTRKPYRMADNLRFWISATKLRWDLTLELDVMGLVNGTSNAAWQEFETAIWRWTASVRTEMAEEIEGKGVRTNGSRWC